MYKFSSLPLAISAATAIANWASSSSELGGAAASRGRGASIAVHASAAGASLLLLLCCPRAAGRVGLRFTDAWDARGAGVCSAKGADAGAAAAVFACYCDARRAARQRVSRPRGGGVTLGKLACRLARSLGAGRQPAGWCSLSHFHHDCVRAPNVREQSSSGRRRRLGRARGRARINSVARGDDFRSRAAAASTRRGTLGTPSTCVRRRASSTCITTILAPRLGLFSRQVRRGRVHLLRAGTTLRGLRLERRRHKIRVAVLRL